MSATAEKSTYQPMLRKLCIRIRSTSSMVGHSYTTVYLEKWDRDNKEKSISVKSKPVNSNRRVEEFHWIMTRPMDIQSERLRRLTESFASAQEIQFALRKLRSILRATFAMHLSHWGSTSSLRIPLSIDWERDNRLYCSHERISLSKCRTYKPCFADSIESYHCTYFLRALDPSNRWNSAIFPSYKRMQTVHLSDICPFLRDW